MTRIELEDEELAVLDGQCRDEVQQEVDAAKRRIAYRIRYPDLRPEIAGLIVDAVSEAHTNGILIYQEIRINQCDLCGWMGQYPRHRSGPQAGRVDYDKPRATTPGIELAKRFVTLQGSVTLGGCTRCVNQALPALREELRGVRAQLPDNLRYQEEVEDYHDDG